MSGSKVITWVHLSDYHFRFENAHTPPINITDQLVDDLSRRTTFSDKLNDIDFLVFTGDLVHKGVKDEYETSYNDTLKPVIDALGLTNDKVFIIPGNHEVYRNSISDLRNQSWSDLLDGKITLKDIENLKEKKNADLIFNVFNNYNDFIKKRFPHIKNINKSGFLNSIDAGGQTVEIVGINTAWLAKGDSLEDEKLSIGLPFLSEIMKKSKTNPALRLLIMHHPLDYLRGCREEYEEISPVIKNKIDLILHGHMHEKRYSPYMYTHAVNEKPLTCIPGGSIFNDDIIQRFYYSFGVFNVKTRCTEIYNRVYSAERRDFDKAINEFPVKFYLPARDSPYIKIKVKKVQSLSEYPKINFHYDRHFYFTNDIKNDILNSKKSVKILNVLFTSFSEIEDAICKKIKEDDFESFEILMLRRIRHSKVSLFAERAEDEGRGYIGFIRNLNMNLFKIFKQLVTIAVNNPNNARTLINKIQLKEYSFTPTMCMYIFDDRKLLFGPYIVKDCKFIPLVSIEEDPNVTKSQYSNGFKQLMSHYEILNGGTLGSQIHRPGSDRFTFYNGKGEEPIHDLVLKNYNKINKILLEYGPRYVEYLKDERNNDFDDSVHKRFDKEYIFERKFDAVMRDIKKKINKTK